MKFTKTATDPHSSARAGVIETDHGSIPTPIFMPVGTVGSVKGVWHRDLRDDIDARIILGNTYHLRSEERTYRPGACERRPRSNEAESRLLHNG